MNKVENSLQKQYDGIYKNIDRLNKDIDRLRGMYRFNQSQIKDTESKIKNHFPFPSPNSEYIETLKTLRNQEQQIATEGRLLKDKKENIDAEIKKLKNPLVSSTGDSKNEVQPSDIIKFSLSNKLLCITDFLYSKKTCENVFLRIVSDWQEECFEALFKKEIWKARWINVRYTYAFLAAMWQKSPIGDLIEFVSKLAK